MKKKAKRTCKPRFEKDVHTEHCCAIHGCKYGEDDYYCTVMQQKKPQSFPCPRCLNPNLTALNVLKIEEQEYDARRKKEN